MAKSYISAALKELVFKRAHGCCEYCKCPADFTTELFSIEHILPRSKGGLDDYINLALACIGCIIFKSDKTESIDPVSQQIVPLFNPRTMIWREHFTWDKTLTLMLGKTAIGRATIECLQVNRRQVRNLRRALIAIEEHPPKLGE
jgi:HNH endonuclease